MLRDAPLRGLLSRKLYYHTEKPNNFILRRLAKPTVSKDA
jgi:hypothetical protein